MALKQKWMIEKTKILAQGRKGEITKLHGTDKQVYFISVRLEGMKSSVIFNANDVRLN